MLKEKKRYVVGVAYTMYGYLTVEAESEEEALKEAKDSKQWVLQDVEEADYLEDSWDVDGEFLEEENFRKLARGGI